MLGKILPAWAALGVALTSATQLRFGEAPPIGIGEVLLVLWLVFVGFCLLRGVRFTYSDAFRHFAVYWGLSAVLLAAGTVVGIVSNKLDAEHALHDALAFAFVWPLTCLLAIRFGTSSNAEYHLTLARATFFTLSAIGLALLAASLVTSQLGPIGLWYYERRFQGWAQNPNQLAMFMLPMPFLGWYLLKQARGPGRTILYVVTIIACVAVGLATESDALRVAWAGSLIVMLAWLWCRSIVRSRGGSLYISHVAVPIALLSLVVALGSGIVAGIEQISDQIYEKGERGAIGVALWTNGLEAIGHSPLFGFGPGAYSGWERPFQGREAHNTLIDWGMSTGILGIMLHLSLWAWCAWRAIHARSPALLAVVACLVADAMFGYSLRHPFYWLVLVLVLTLTERRALAVAPNAAGSRDPVQWQEERRAVPAFLAPSGSTSSS